MTATVLWVLEVTQRRGERGPISLAIRSAASLLIVILCALLAPIPPATGQDTLDGVALVIGQSEYEHLPKLANPPNDAKSVDELLTRLGFKTDLVENRSAKRLARDLDDFLKDADGADVAVVYYSGHGIEAGGENYLIPVDTTVSKETVDEASLISVSHILEELRQRVRVTVVFLDACRTNPFPPGAIVQRPDGAVSVPIGSAGLAITKGVMLADQGTGADSLGEIINFAAAPGQVALDGQSGTNSPYAAALIKHLGAKGLDFGQVMTLVSEEVYLATKGQQRPWTNASLRRLLYFGGSAEDESTDEALVTGERRQLLLTIATTPPNLRQTVETIASVDGVPLDGLYAMLKALGVETSRDPEALGKQLRSGADKLRTFMAERGSKSSDIELARLSELADRAVAEGALKAAIVFHEKAKTRVSSLEAAMQGAEAGAKARRLEYAAVYAKSAGTRELAFDYLNAARDWAEAYEQAKIGDSNRALDYKLAQAKALTKHGEERGDNEALSVSIGLYRSILESLPSKNVTHGRNLVQVNLGIALTILGERENSPDRLEEAAALYRAASKDWNRHRAPLDWATAQMNLGSTLSALGELEGSPKRFEEAIIAYRAALEEWTLQRAPLDWALTQMNLGNALKMLGESERGSQRLEEAIAAYRAALKIFTRDRAPLDWALTQLNLGTALSLLGGRESGAKGLEEGVEAYREALEVLARDRMPLAWALAQLNLGTALKNLGVREDGTERLEEAVGCYREALREMTRDRVPLKWVLIQNNLGDALSILGERQSGTQRLKEAVTAYKEALQEKPRDRLPLDWARTHINLGVTLRILGEREIDTERLEEAVESFHAAMQELTHARFPVEWARGQMYLGVALRIVGERTKDASSLVLGRNSMLAAWDEYKSSGYDYDAYFREEIGKFDAAIAAIK